jgi:hypothetical protein
MAKSIVASRATEKKPAAPEHCAKCGEKALFCWCGVERQPKKDAPPLVEAKRLKLGGAA